jgi:CPA2 family monovalent cation:H+ antiporter-2
VLAIALGVAFGAAKLFGVSLALGAFFAGMIMSESELSHRAAEESLPLRDAFSVLFFVSVGMLFNPASLLDNTWPILATLFIIVIGKSIAAFLIVVAFRYPIGTALMISASLAQIGEFSFILAELGVGLNLLPEQGRDLILAGAILSIVLNPLAFALVDRLKPWLEKQAAQIPEMLPTASDALSAPVETEGPPPKTALDDHTILVGYGRVGSLIGQSLKEAGLPFLVIEDADKTIAKLNADGIETVTGNAAKAEVFDAANPAGARRLILAIPNAFEAGQIVLRARGANPALNIIARAHSDAEVDHLTGFGADTVIMGEREIARGIVEEVLKDPTADRPKPPMAGPLTSDQPLTELGDEAAPEFSAESPPDPESAAKAEPKQPV